MDERDRSILESIGTFTTMGRWQPRCADRRYPIMQFKIGRVMPSETMPPSGEFPTPDPALNAVLEDLVRGARSALTESFVGAYLQGSFAVGDADEHSDVDFLIATARELSDAQVQALESMHQRIYDTTAAEWARHLEGSYVPLHVLRRHVPPGVLLPYLEPGSSSGRTTMTRSSSDGWCASTASS